MRRLIDDKSYDERSVKTSEIKYTNNVELIVIIFYSSHSIIGYIELKSDFRIV